MAELTADDNRSRTSEVSADDADLQAGIGNLAGLVAGSLGLPELLAEVARSQWARYPAPMVLE